MALDWGTRKIGIALSDPMRWTARSLTILQRKSRREDFEQLAQMVQEHQVTAILIGLPQAPYLPDNEQTKPIRTYGKALAKHLNLPLTYWDETLSSEDAIQTMKEQGKIRWQQRRPHLDAVAAATILQDYLDWQKEMDLRQQSLTKNL